MYTLNSKYSILLFLIVSTTAAFTMEPFNQVPQSGQQHPRARRNLGFENMVSDETPQEPAEKRRKLNDHTEQRITVQQGSMDAVQITFSLPDILVYIAQYLYGTNFCSFARTSKACLQASQLRHLREKMVARTILDRKAMPLHHLAEHIRNNSDPARFYGIRCAIAPLIKLVHKKTSLLDELPASSFEMTGQIMVDIPALSYPETTSDIFSSQEKDLLKPVKYIRTAATEEYEIINLVSDLHKKFPNHNISLRLSINSNDDNVGVITEQLIEGLAQYPLVSLACRQKHFPQGLGCLGNLHQLRELFIDECTIDGDDGISDTLLKGLPHLVELQVTRSGITTISPLIDTLPHLAILNLSNNNIHELPKTFRNLSTLKALGLQNKPLSVESLSQNLPCLQQARYLALSYPTKETGPIPVLSPLPQIETLVLNGNGKFLEAHKDEFKKLKKIFLFNIAMQQIPPCLLQLPTPKILGGEITETAIIPYEMLQYIAHNNSECSLFSMKNNIDGIKQVAQLWQLIQVNQYYSLENKIRSLNPQEKLGLQQQISTIRFLELPVITADNLRKLTLPNTQRVTEATDCIKILFSNESISSGLPEFNRARKFHNHPLFNITLCTISGIICNDIPVYNCSPGTTFCQAIVPILIELSENITNIMTTIKNGLTCTPEQFEKCIKPLVMTINNPDRLSRCITIIANLFFYYAIENNNITNAAVMLNRGAELNGYYPAADIPTVLHLAIHNRLKAKDSALQEQIEHVIYFLVSRGANMQQTNKAGESPLDLIRRDNPLHKKITEWYQKKN
jgi:hypothetical protein